MFGLDQVSLQGLDADSLVSELSPNGPTERVMGGLYAEAYCPSDGVRWRFYAGQPEPEVGEIRARWGQ